MPGVGRRHHLRRARLLDAHLAAARQDGAPGRHAPPTSPTRSARRTRSTPRARSAPSRRRGARRSSTPSPRAGAWSSRRSSATSCVRASGPGGVLRLKDVARVELGALNYDTSNTLDGKPAIGMACFLQPGANALDVAAGGARARWRSCKTGVPAGRGLRRSRSTPRASCEASIKEVIKTHLRGGAAGARWWCSSSCRPGARR